MRFGVKTGDVVVGGVTVALAAYVLFGSRDLDFYAEGVPGPGFFPIVVGIALLVSGLLLIASRVLHIAVPEDEDGEEQIMPRSLMVWLALLLSAALIPILGFVTTMVLLVAALLFGFERRRSIGALVAVVVIPGLAYWLFASVLGVPLPTGIFGT